MKKLLKCLSLLLIVPVISVLALSGCKEKDNKNGTREYISYKEADSILTSAYTSLYGEELEPPAATPSAYTTKTAVAASSKDIKLIKNNTALEEVKIDENNFVSSINGEIKVNDNYYMYISGECFIPIKLVRTLLRDGVTNIVGNTIEFSYENKPKIDPDNLKCKLRVNVYENVFSIEIQRESNNIVIDTSIVNIVFDKDLKATHILYTTSKTANQTEIFAFASYNLAEKTTKVLKIEETTTTTQTTIKSAISSFANKESTPNTTYDFAALYVTLI